MSRAYDKYMEHQNYVDECSCCECGYIRNGSHHPAIRCPVTGRCGSCGNQWPCPDHAPEVPERLKKWADGESYVKN